MRRWARALPIIVIGVLAAIATTTATESAPAGAGAAGFARASISRSSVARRADGSGPPGSDLTITPVGSPAGRLDVAVDPGESVQRSFVLANRSAGLRLTVRLGGVDATSSAGEVQLAHDASADGPGSWISLSDVVSTIEPGAQVRVSVNVAPPATADPGTVTAGVVATVDQAVRASDNATVTDRATADLPIAINVKGAATALVSVAQVRAMRHTGSDYLEVTFQNSGATPTVMSGTVRVGGTHPVTSSVQVTAAPLTHTSKRVPFVMPSGATTVPVSVSTNDSRGDEATWNGKVGFAPPPTPASAPTPSAHAGARSHSSGSSSMPLPALVVGAALLVAAALWFGAEIRRSRAQRRARRVVPSVPPVAVAPSAVATPAADAVPTAAAAPVVPVEVGDTSQLGAVAAQLAALVESIDRLAGRLGVNPQPVVVPQGVPPQVVVPPVVTQPVVTKPVAAQPVAPPVTPAEVPRADGRDLSPMFYAPAANSVPGEEVGPFDWPSPAQLDEFVARRNAQQSDPQ